MRNSLAPYNGDQAKRIHISMEFVVLLVPEESYQSFHRIWLKCIKNK